MISVSHLIIIMITGQEGNFRYWFLLVAALGLLCAPDRSDPNIVLGLFAFLMWTGTQFPHKHRILWMVLATILGDLLWILVVSVGTWGQHPEGNHHLRVLTQVCSIMNLILKITLVVYSILKIDGCHDLISKNGFSQKFLYL